jgi:hypothetical protein
MMEELRKIAKLGRIQIRNGTKLKAILIPGKEVIALNRLHADRRASAILRGPHIQIDDVKRSVIDKHGNFAVLQIIEATTGKRVSLGGEILHGRRKVQFAVKPRFDGVLTLGNKTPPQRFLFPLAVNPSGPASASSQDTLPSLILRPSLGYEVSKRPSGENDDAHHKPAIPGSKRMRTGPSISMRSIDWLNLNFAFAFPCATP